MMFSDIPELYVLVIFLFDVSTSVRKGSLVVFTVYVNIK